MLLSQKQDFLEEMCFAIICKVDYHKSLTQKQKNKTYHLLWTTFWQLFCQTPRENCHPVTWSMPKAYTVRGWPIGKLKSLYLGWFNDDTSKSSLFVPVELSFLLCRPLDAAHPNDDHENWENQETGNTWTNTNRILALAFHHTFRYMLCC